MTSLEPHDLNNWTNRLTTCFLLLIVLGGCGTFTPGMEGGSSETKQLVEQGYTYYSNNENDRALQLYRRAMQTTTTKTAPTLKADIHYRIGKVLFRQQQYQESLVSYSRALAILTDFGAPLDLSLVHHSMGITYQNIGQIEPAREQFLLALSIRREIGDMQGEIRTLVNIGGSYLAQGRYTEALQYYETAKALSEKDENPRPADLGAIITHLGAVYSELGQYDKALELHNKAFELYEKNDNFPGMAIALHNIGFIRAEQEDHSAAIDSYRKSLSLRKDEDPHQRANTLNNLGLALADNGQLPLALTTLEGALREHRRLNTPKNIAATLDSIGTVYTKQGDFSRAQIYYLESLGIVRQMNDREGERVTLGNIGQMLEMKNKKESAIIFYKMAINLSQQIRSELNLLPQTEQRAYADRIEKNYRQLADLLIDQGRLAEAEQVLTMLKEEEFSRFMRRRNDSPATSQVTSSYTQDEEPWMRRYQEISNELITLGREFEELKSKKSGTITAGELVRLKQLEADMKIARGAFWHYVDELDEYFSNQDSQRAKEFGQKEIEMLSQLQAELKKLGPGTVLITVFVTEDRLRFLLTTPDQQVHRDSIITREELSSLIIQFREAINSTHIEPKNPAKALHSYLIKPLKEDLRQVDAQTLLLSLDDILRYVPFAALFDGEKYLGEQYDLVIYTPAARGNLSNPPIKNWRIAGLGVSEQTSEEFEPLAGVRQELDEIIRVEEKEDPSGVMPGVIRLNSQFTSDQLSLDLREGYPVIHIASHYKFVPGNELDSFLLLGDNERLSLKNLRQGDFPLTAVDLLTLSACETAYGGRDAQGREIESFGVFAQKYGAKSVLATLWPVDDLGTAEFMATFYQLRQQGMTKAKALRTTQEMFLGGEGGRQVDGSVAEDSETRPIDQSGPASSPDQPVQYNHPYYWAPFILMGNYL